MYKVPNPELRALLEQHQQWLESSAQRGAKLELVETDLSDIDFSHLDLSEVVFASCNLSGTNFANTDLYGAYLGNTSFEGADLTAATLVKAVLNDANFTGAILTNATLAGVEGAGQSIFKDAILENADLRYVHLLKSNLDNARMTGCRLERVGFHKTSLVDTDLRGALDMDKTIAISATVRLNGDIQLLEGDALREWLLAAVVVP